MQTLKTILLILICAAVTGACGFKGPLYLPDENPAGEQQRPQAPDVKKEEENEGSSGNQSATPD
jgi:predicted small lipoprotein YifL